MTGKSMEVAAVCSPRPRYCSATPLINAGGEDALVRNDRMSGLAMTEKLGAKGAISPEMGAKSQ